MGNNKKKQFYLGHTLQMHRVLDRRLQLFYASNLSQYIL